MVMSNLIIPFPDFKFADIINPEEFDANTASIKAKVNEIIASANLNSVVGSDGKAKIYLSGTQDILAEIAKQPVGIYSIYGSNTTLNRPMSGSARGIAQITSTSPSYGYVWAIDLNGAFYTNFLNAGVWKGWVTIGDSTPKWLNLPLTAPIVEYASTQTPQYCKVGSRIEIRGAVKGFTANLMPVGTLPVGYRPVSQQHTYMQSFSSTNSMARFARYTIGTDGIIKCEFDSDNTWDATKWYPIATSFTL